MKYFILLALFFLKGVSGYAQIELSGLVSDSATAKPLSGASVSLENSFTGTATDESGNFRIKIPENFNGRIRINFLGYEPVIISQHEWKTGKIQVLLKRKMFLADEVVVAATRAGSYSGVAYNELSSEEINSRNMAADLPYMLQDLPSVVVTSDAGNGVGYTGLRIRGSDASRINVTVNGIPVNDSESQLVYWVDLPDMAASANNIQVQRGAGTSTNGAGAFGASINILTHKLNSQPYVESSHTFGSFGTIKNNLSAGTGLLDNHWTFDARLSKINSDGYVDRASSNLKSIFISQGYYGRQSILKFNIFSGKEITYQSWNGIPECRLRDDVQGMIDFAVRNGLDSYDSLNLLESGRTYNYYTYKNQVDDYQQDHYQLHYALQLSPKLSVNSSLHYTRGKGFYEEFKKNQSLLEYGVTDSVPGFVFEDVNLIRRKWLDNDFYGFIFSSTYVPYAKLSITSGASWNQYQGDHFDELIWAEYLPVDKIPYRYDFNSALKTDFNAFSKATLSLSSRLTLLADLQVRRVSYYYSMKNTGNTEIPFYHRLWFLNPKAALTYQLFNGQSAYFSISTANKEPSRNDYRNNPYGVFPKPERLYDFETGYTVRHKSFYGNFNYYMMYYENQLVMNGSLNDVGEPLRINVKESYRTGIEAEAGIRISKKINFRGNATLSRSRIKKYDEVIPDFDLYVNDTISYTNSPIGYSPDFIAQSLIEFAPTGFLSFDFKSKYLGSQFLDNTGDESRMLKSYFTNDFSVMWKFKMKWFRECTLSMAVHNVFNHLYESNGYTYSYIYFGEKVTENFYYPQAGIHWASKINLKF